MGDEVFPFALLGLVLEGLLILLLFGTASRDSVCDDEPAAAMAAAVAAAALLIDAAEIGGMAVLMILLSIS